MSPHRRPPGSGFVGRERELSAAAAALASPPALVLVEGEAGVGKSRLVQELLASSDRALLAVCPPYRESLTLGPVADALRQAGPAPGRLPLSRLAGALRPLFPEWEDQLPRPLEPLADPLAARHRLFRALAELLGRLGLHPLVVEDAHWADEATLEFLLFLGSRPEAPSRVVSYRPEDVSAGSLLLRLSSRPPAGPGYARLTLATLDRAGTAGLVAAALGGPADESFVDRLHAHTDGLPLAVEESVRLLRDRGELVQAADERWQCRAVPELLVPPTIRDATLERLAADSAARPVLAAAAVLADPVPEPVLREVAGAEPAMVARALATGLLREDRSGRVGFRHALMAKAVYQVLSGAERRTLHAAAGAVLERGDALPVAQLVRHFREAGQTGQWSRYAEQAADRAAGSDDHRAAMAVLDELLSTARLPGPPRARLARKLALAAIRLRDVPDAWHRQVVATVRAALPGLDPAAQAGVRSPLGRLLLQVGEFDAARRELVFAARHLDRHDPVDAARVMTLLGLPLLAGWPAATHLWWLRRAAGPAGRVTTVTDRLKLAADRATGLLLLGAPDGWKVAAELPDAPVTPRERFEVARGSANLAIPALVWGRYTDAQRLLDRAWRLAVADDDRIICRNVEKARAELAWYTGAWDGLAGRLEALVGRADREGLLTVDTAPLYLFGRLRAAHGDRAGARALFRRALAEAARIDAQLEPSAGLARLWLDEGEVGPALEITEPPIRMVAAKRIWLWATEIAPVRVEALLADRQVDAADQLVAAFARGLRGRDAPAPRAALATCRALRLAGTAEQPRAGAVDWLRAAAGFGRAARAWDRLPRPYDALLARERQARCLIGAGSVAPGVALLAEVFGGITALGATDPADRVGRALREHGVPVRRPGRGGRPGYGDQLSPRELEVVRHVVAGRTNREIAHALSRSPNTVATQLGSAMRKLRVSSRTALAVRAVESGAAVFSSV